MTTEGGGQLVNKVAESGLITIDMEDWARAHVIESFDIKPFLFREAILKEKDFRESLKSLDWEKYQDKVVAVFCSADAILPRWAWMLISMHLQSISKATYFGTLKEVRQSIILDSIRSIKGEEFQDKKVVIKGCGDEDISEAAYLEITNKLVPFVSSIMYGEPCSTVPIYKSRK